MQANSAIFWKSASTGTSQYFWKSFSEYSFHHLAGPDNMIQSSCKFSHMIFQTTCFSVVKYWCGCTWYISPVIDNHQGIFVNSFCFSSRWWRIFNKYRRMYLYLIDISLIGNFFVICSCLTEASCASASVGRISHDMISSCWAHFWISMSSWNEMSSQLAFPSSHTAFVAFSPIPRSSSNHWTDCCLLYLLSVSKSICYIDC